MCERDAEINTGNGAAHSQVCTSKIKGEEGAEMMVRIREEGRRKGGGCSPSFCAIWDACNKGWAIGALEDKKMQSRRGRDGHQCHWVIVVS